MRFGLNRTFFDLVSYCWLLAALACALPLLPAKAANLRAADPDFALIDVNSRLPYAFFTAADSGASSSSGVILCYYDAVGRPKVATYGAITASPSPEQCERLVPDRAGLPKPARGWKEVAYTVPDGAPFLGGHLRETTGGARPLDNPYIYTAADGAQQGFYIVIRDPKTRHVQLCSDDQCADDRTDIDQAGLVLVVPVAQTLAFLSDVSDVAMNTTYDRQLLLLRRFPREMVSFDNHIFLVPSGLLPEFTDKTASEQLNLLARFIKGHAIRATRLVP